MTVAQQPASHPPIVGGPCCTCCKLMQHIAQLPWAPVLMQISSVCTEFRAFASDLSNFEARRSEIVQQVGTVESLHLCELTQAVYPNRPPHCSCSSTAPHNFVHACS